MPRTVSAHLYPEIDAPGTPGWDQSAYVAIRSHLQLPASRVPPVGHDELDTRSAPGGFLLSGVTPLDMPRTAPAWLLRARALSRLRAGHGLVLFEPSYFRWAR